MSESSLFLASLFPWWSPLPPFISQGLDHWFFSPQPEPSFAKITSKSNPLALESQLIQHSILKKEKQQPEGSGVEGVFQPVQLVTENNGTENNGTENKWLLGNSRGPLSGAELYQQRWAALKKGRVYTHLPPDSFYEEWSNAQNQPTHQEWQQLLRLEAQAMSFGQNNNLLNILVGDSLSLWFPPLLLPRGSFWLNQGISGENTGQVLKRLSGFDKINPHQVYIMAGINDIRQGVSDRTILHNLEKIVKYIKKKHPQSKIIIQSILPTRLASIKVERIRGLNQEILTLSQRQNIEYLDLYVLFANEKGEMRKEFTTDGIHLSATGYYVWQSALWGYMDRR